MVDRETAAEKCTALRCPESQAPAEDTKSPKNDQDDAPYSTRSPRPCFLSLSSTDNGPGRLSSLMPLATITLV